MEVHLRKSGWRSPGAPHHDVFTLFALGQGVIVGLFSR